MRPTPQSEVILDLSTPSNPFQDLAEVLHEEHGAEWWEILDGLTTAQQEALLRRLQELDEQEGRR